MGACLGAFVVELILGGAASGKSRFAVKRLLTLPHPVLLATGKAHDLAFRQQIEAHCQERPGHLPVVECGVHLAAALEKLHGASILVESLDFWAFTALDAGVWVSESAALMEVVENWQQGRLLIVSQEMGLSPLVMDAGTRTLARVLGGLHQKLAAVCQHVYLVVAGLPQTLK